MRDLDLSSRQLGHDDSHLFQDGYVLSVAKVKGVDVESRWCVCLLGGGTAVQDGQLQQNECRHLIPLALIIVPTEWTFSLAKTFMDLFF